MPEKKWPGPTNCPDGVIPHPNSIAGQQQKAAWEQKQKQGSQGGQGKQGQTGGSNNNNNRGSGYRW